MNLGVDLKNFNPKHEIMSEKAGLVKFWRKFLSEKEISEIYLATDPDREGEAIAHETAKILGLKKDQYQRILFYEITPKSIKEALANPLTINEKLVEAQLSRQVLDRMVGFCLSNALRKKLKANSAGRVQSIVLKLIVEREKLVEKFEKKKEYIVCGICPVKNKDSILSQIEEKTGDILIYKEKEEAEKTKEKLSLEFKLINKKEEESFIVPKQSLITSLLLSEAKSQLGFGVEKTTKLAQKLYEGVSIGGKMIGLITYPRTDSTRINKGFLNQTYNYIKDK
jgi:DNA topoisomerase-1